MPISIFSSFFYRLPFIFFIAFLLTACIDRRSSGTTPQSSSSAENLQDAPNRNSGNDTLTSDSKTEDTPIILSLSWQANPGAIDGYMVYYGSSPENATALLTVTNATKISFNPAMDLGLRAGDASCFRIKAYNADGSSDFSDAVCFTYDPALQLT